ncbi:MAG: carboxypeptidase regulatory-like domain-containing protein [Acidobacteria bacterium]|nr:carboxypeptidase regulatory-like domain-containing protein [Acidobacteriota bacterium]
MKLKTAMLVILVVALGLLSAFPADAQVFKCLPSCDPQDARFLAIANGAGFITLSDPSLDLEISVPAGTTTFTVGVFDGDDKDGAGGGHWDSGSPATFSYTLYADPNRNHSTATVVQLQPGFPSTPSTSMPDNAWIDFTITTDPSAKSPSGNYYYLLRIQLQSLSIATLNAFKVRTGSAQVGGTSLFPTPKPFSYIANIFGSADLNIIYPSFPASTPTRYDGSFNFYFDEPVSQHDVTVWDGDFDHGKFDGTDKDADDLDTPNAPFLPSWSTLDTLPEGIALGLAPATGNPPDDRSSAGSGIYLVKPPSIRYDVIFPDGRSFANDNPSGNQEWEQFKISTDPLNHNLMDYSTPAPIPGGIYQVRIQGADMQNLNAILLPGRVLCVDASGTPCKPLRPFLLGDTVFEDTDGNGVQDPGEPGIPNVAMELLDQNGVAVGTALTDANGHYLFEVEALTYTVNVSSGNFTGEGGALNQCNLTTPQTCTETIVNANILTCDFGCRKPDSIGDRVWNDVNGNGVQDPGEPGIDFVTVNLLDSDGNVVDTAETAGDGNYSFSNVTAGTYTVSVDDTTLPGGATPTYDLDGIATPHTAVVTLTTGTSRTDVDFGYRGNASVGDRVWNDRNGNGVQDAGEPGLNGVTVQIYDFNNNLLASQVTSGDGNYTFSHLLEDQYTVQVVHATVPAGYVQTFDLDGVATPDTAVVVVLAGSTHNEVDFGYRSTATGSVGDRVWLDSNGNGAQDAGEPGLNGVTVQLLDAANSVLATATTSGDGNYTFPGLADGNYSVRIVTASLPPGVTPTFDLDGIATPNIASFSLAGGANRTDVDFGYRGTASAGDRVWLDSNGNQAQDAGEPGLNGVTVELLDASNNVLATATTSGDGNYTFSNLMAGNYSVRTSNLPAGVAPTYDLDGIGTPNIASFSLAGGANRTDVDFGYRGTASVGDRVWLDSNGNGAQDTGEPGLNGVTVELLDASNNVLATATTSGDGNYTFSNLMGGNYSVRTSNLPAGVTPTFDLDGIATPNIASFTLAAGANRTDVDFGYRGTASVGDRVWLDSNADGVQDTGETGINNVTVELLDAGNSVVGTTTTSGDGNYTFSNLMAGNYSVRIVAGSLPAGVAPSFDLDGIATPNIASFTLAAGASRTDVDFGYAGTGSIGDRLWLDTNGDGVQDPGEVGINGTTVQLLDGGGNVIGTTTTAGDGIYHFNNLTPGTYSVRVVSTTLPAGVTPTFDLDGITTPNIASFTLAAGTSRTDVDFGYRGTASVGDRVWLDSNANGVQDTGETGLNGVTVQLLDAGNNVLATAVTAGDGNYTFGNLLGGAYSVRVVTSSLPPGVSPTFDLDGIGTPNVATFTLNAGASRTDVDFGYAGTGSVGDRVWFDTNGDGVQDAGEAGINDVTVRLLDAGNHVVTTTTTAGDGNYTFSNLTAGNYSVQVDAATLPPGLVETFDLDGAATPNIASFTLAAGTSRTDVDFGYRTPATASVGDRVWDDRNGDGVQDAGEPGLNAVTVELLDAGNNVVGSAITSGDGNYTFSSLVAGTYSVRVVTASLPAGMDPTFDADGIATPSIATFTLATGESRTDIDFGYRGTASVGDRVWTDANGDGVQDPDETGINDVTVELLDASNNVVASTTTSGDGNYTFSNLNAGNYSVRIVTASLPAGVAPTFDLDGVATPNIASFALAGGEARTDVDFGYRGTGSVGDRLWLDTNGNGVQDAGEAGINGATVQLLDGGGNVIGTTTSAGDGNYQFSNLTAGTYSVRIVPTTLPAGVTPTFDLDGIATPNIATFTLDGGASRSDVDFGYRGTASVGDRVWRDTNSNGIQDAGEAGINGVTVQLLDSSNNVIATATTSGDGNYTFSNLLGGSYSVRVVAGTLPAGLSPTYDLDGTGTPNIATFTLNAGTARTDVDFGYGGTGSVGDRLWIDSNGNGVQDAGETGLNGVTVELLDASNTVVGTAVTSGDGNYTFSNLAGGSYSVRVVAATLPAGLAPTYDLDGVATPNIAAFSLGVGQNRTDVDFGYRGTASVGDRLWIDGNGNGVQDAGETGINGVTVELLNASSTVVGSGVTSGDGNYTFSNLDSGTYSVRVVAATLPAGLAPTYDLDGIATPNIASFALAGGQNRTDVDFGYRGTASVGDRLWLDANGNGVQDAGETGINGVTVELLNASNTVVGTTTTSGDGNYTFSNLTAGTYSVRVVAATLPAGLAPTYDLDGIATPNIASFSLAGGANRTDVDFGYRGTGSVGDRVWLDTNADGVQDAGETGINGVTVELLNASNTVVGTTTTSGDGNYTFSNLTAGTYSVRVVVATLPAGVAPSYDLDGIATPNIASFSLAGGVSRTDVDFGYRGTASVGDRVWLDSNGNGVQDAGETGLNGVTVQLLNASSTVIATATTSGDGNYTFSNLTPGNYSVRVVTSSLPAGLTQTYDLDGIATANIASFSLAAGANRTDVDFGYRGAGVVGDRVWLDSNGNGVQDAGEAGINGVTVQLLDGGGNVIATTTTAGDGNYGFSNLVAGTYSVRIVTGSLPAGVSPTFDLDGVATPNVATFSLGAGASRTDVDFGYRGTASVGDRVWLDANGNGVQDAGETGINGVTVQLLDGGGNVVGSATTAGDGNYTFSNLAAGSYSVRVVSGTLPDGVTPTFDLDGIATPNIASFTLAAGANRTDVDFGYRGTGSAGDRVWNDANGNGVQDAGETGINGATVQLFNGATLVATTTTAGDGNYTFNNLTPATYTVKIVPGTLPAGVVTPTFDLDGIATANQATFTLAAGQNRTDVDFGYRGAGSIGDRVWLDTNGNGVQDAGETGINGATVQLFNGATLVATTTTAGDGNYTFSNLAPATYTVKIVPSTLPAGVVPTFDLDGIATANQATLTLAAGASRTDVDFGYRGTASVGDRLWYDTNGNATQDAGETGINGVTVQLLDSGSNVIATTTTSGDGNYTFANLLGGSYTVRVVASTLPAGFSPTFDLDGIATANTASFTLNAGASRTDVDFGYRGTASVGDRVWYDVNGNGVQDSGETGINGATVQLLDNGGNVIATATAAGNGNYSFTNLNAGTYSVRVVSSTLPAGYGPTFDLDGIATANVATFTLTAGQSRTDVDFGYRGTLSVGDRVWNDGDGDGVQDASETGLNGVTVQLLDSGGTVIATTTTAGNGNYTFSNLGAGTYTVRVVSSTLPAGYTPTFDLDGTGTAHQATFSLTANRTDVDFGYRAVVCTAGYFKDTFTTNSFSNNEGTLSWSGPWIENDVAGAGVSTGNVTVGTPFAGYLILRDYPDTGTQPSAAREVNLSGFASATLTVDLHLKQVEPDDAAVIEISKDGGATYTVLETLTGYTTTDLVTSRTYDISAYRASNTRIRFRISANYGGSDDLFKVDAVRIDATCTLQTFSIGDRVWKDTDGDGVQDSGEPGISGVTVHLLNSSNTVVATTTTDSNGNYTFSNVAAGNYTVKVVSSSLPAGYMPTFDLDGVATPHTASFNLTASRTDVDFGYRPTTCAAGSFKDTFTTNSFSNNEGTLSWSGAWIENDVAGVGVSSGNVTVGTPYAGYLILRDSPDTGTEPSAARQVNLSGFASATLTVAFHIKGVEADDAVVIEVSKDGGVTYTALETLTGYTGTYISSRTYDISAYIASNTRIRFRISGNYGGTDDLFKVDTVQIDATCTPQTFSIGNLVWKDTNGNGVQDTGEPGISGVTVQLLNSSNTVVATTTTDSNGIYGFSNVVAGNYTVRVVSSSLPAGYTPTFDLDGIATPNTASFNLTANRTDVDFGYRPGGTLSVGDRVWKDANANGIQDSDEPGISGVTVQLLNGSGTVIATTTTNSTGNYTFTGLFASTYTVKVVASSLPSATFTETYDLDGVATANQATFTLTVSRSDVDFGYHFPSPTAGGTATLGYWKTHPEAWPVQSITIGGITYTKDQAITWLGTPVRGDESIALFHQLVPAELNALMSNNISCIFPIIQAADAWMAQHPVGSGVSTSSSTGQAGNALEVQLDSYNNGNLCAPHRN